MSNETTELALQVRAGNEQIEALWTAVYRLIAYWAYRYRPSQGTRLYETDDLIQAGFLGVCDALETYSPEFGSFNTHLYYKVRTRFAEVIGTRGNKKRPEIDAVSLDEIIYENSETTRADMIEDPAANFADDLVDQICDAQDTTAIFLEIMKLPDLQRKALLLTAWHGLTYSDAADQLGVSAQKVWMQRYKATAVIRKTKIGYKIHAQRYQRHVSLGEYQRTRISSVEWALMMAEDRAEYLAHLKQANDY